MDGDGNCILLDPVRYRSCQLYLPYCFLWWTDADWMPCYHRGTAITVDCLILGQQLGHLEAG